MSSPNPSARASVRETVASAVAATVDGTRSFIAKAIRGRMSEVRPQMLSIERRSGWNYENRRKRDHTCATWRSARQSRDRQHGVDAQYRSE